MTGVYRVFGKDGRLLYVGISARPRTRIWEHFYQSSAWAAEFGTLTVEYYSTKQEAHAAEVEAIRTEWPLYNVEHSIDKGSAKRLNWLHSQRPRRMGNPTPSPEEFEAEFQAKMVVVRGINKAIRDALRDAHLVTTSSQH